PVADRRHDLGAAVDGGAGGGRGHADDLVEELARQRRTAAETGRGFAEYLAVGLHRLPLLPEQAEDLVELLRDIVARGVDFPRVVAGQELAADRVEIFLFGPRAERRERLGQF